jgi:methyl-accepting chemotaxis protein
MNATDRLDRIERILEQVAQKQQINSDQIAANAQQIAANTDSIAANTEQIASNTVAITELRLLLRDFLQAGQKLM